MLAEQAGLSVEGGRLQLNHVILQGTGADNSSALDAHNAAIVGLEAVHVSGWDYGLQQDGGVLELQQVWLDGVDVGIARRQTEALVWDGLSISANQLGISWTGQQQRDWLWRNIAIQAPQQLSHDFRFVLDSVPAPLTKSLWRQVPSLP